MLGSDHSNMSCCGMKHSLMIYFQLAARLFLLVPGHPNMSEKPLHGALAGMSGDNLCSIEVLMGNEHCS